MAVLGPQIADLIRRVLELHHAGASLYPLNDPDFHWLLRLADAPTGHITEVLSGLLDFERRHTREAAAAEQGIHPIHAVQSRPAPVPGSKAHSVRRRGTPILAISRLATEPLMRRHVHCIAHAARSC